MPGIPLTFRLILCGLVVIALVTACKDNNTQPKPNDLIGEDTYIDLMVEMQHITTFKNAEPDSVNADSLKNLVYEQYGVTDEQYLRSHRYYQSQLQDQIARIDSVIFRLENEQQMMQSYVDSLRQANRAANDTTRMPEPDPNSLQLQ